MDRSLVIRTTGVVVLLGALAFTWISAGDRHHDSKQRRPNERSEGVGSHQREFDEQQPYANTASAANRYEDAAGQDPPPVNPTEPQLGDPEWWAFPRSRVDLRPHFTRHSHALDASILFRHERLNPMDRHITPDARAVLEALISEHNALGREAVAQRREALSRELDDLVARGAIRPVPLASLPPEDPGKPDSNIVLDPRMVAGGAPIGGIVIKNGQVYAATEEQLPSRKTVDDIRNFLSVNIAGQVTTFFVTQGLMSPADQSKYLNEVYAYSAGERN